MEDHPEKQKITVSGHIEPLPEEKIDATKETDDPPPLIEPPPVTRQPGCGCAHKGDPLLENIPIIMLSAVAIFLLGATYQSILSNASLSE